MGTKQRSSHRRIPRASMLITLSLVILFSCSQKGLAQLRDGDTANAGSNESSSAPSGRVNFDIITLLNGEYLEAFGAGSSRGILRGHPSIPGLELGTTTANALIFSTNSTERMRILANGKVGIGTSDPKDVLHVVDSFTPNRVGTIRLQAGSASAAFIGIWDPGQMLLLSNNRHPATGDNYNTAATGAQLFLWGSDIHFAASTSGPTGNTTDLMRIKGDGRVGIGTINPGSRLHVNGGSIRLAGVADEIPFQLYSYSNSHSLWLTSGNATKSEIHLSPGYAVDYDRSVALQYVPGTTGTVGGILNVGQMAKNNAAFTHGATAFYTNGAERLRINSAGNVGIGTAAPGFKLDVAGQIRSNSGGFVFPDGSVQTTASGGSQWTTSGTSISYNGGNVGIGTTTPGTKLHVKGGAHEWVIFERSGKQLYLNANWADGNAYAQVAPRASDNMGLSLSSKDANPEFLFVATAGNVGIGTTTPSNKLHVAGSITVDGNINAKYQDVAEWVPSSEQLPAGTVVTLDPTRSNHVVATTKSYDTRVAGVISAQPGIALGEKSDNKVLVATTGRVKVKVDATNGPIEIGDLLVTSYREGFAMKSLPVAVSGVLIHRPGTLIGKALEPLAKGTGEILVLLSLQ